MDQLTSAGVPDPQTDARLLLAHVTELPPVELLLHGTQGLTPEQEQRFSSLLLSRASRMPLQYLLGTLCFYGLPFRVDERALIPRPETEILCETALAFMQALPAPWVLDLCTGSGAIAVTIKHECPGAEVTASDISPNALALARENARLNRAEVRFVAGDLFAPVAGERFHCIVSNPPYIESIACSSLQPEVLREPLLALDGGTDGLHFYRRIAAEAFDHLYPGGLLCLEIGDTQAKSVCELLAEQFPCERIAVLADLCGLPRVVCAYALSSPT